jgi:hypothetical protein
MPNFSTDADLLKWEPDLFRLCRYAHQKLAGGSAGATAADASTLTDATADFEDAGVDEGHVVRLSKSGVYDDYFGVAGRAGETELELDAPGGLFSTQTGVAWEIHTFDPQHEEAHFELLERFDVDDANVLNADEADLFNARVLRRASVFRVLEIVFRSQATSEADLFWQKAERYRQLHERDLATLRVRFDVDADGVPDRTKDASSVDLRVEESGDAWPAQ